jgi:glucokinase
MILAGDIGGTKTRLGFFEASGTRLQPASEASYHSRDYPGLIEILRDLFRAHRPRAALLSLGIAGPVRQGRVETPNLPWVVDARHLQDELRCGPVVLLNDLEANAHGLGELGPDDFAVLNPGAPGAAGNQALVSAGTGLGEAGLFWDGARHRPFASEGGHADFAPRTDLERELDAHLAREFGHVSYERVLSGPGLVNIYRFLRQRDGRPEELPALMERLGVKDEAAAISGAALGGLSELCGRALDLFASIYGSEAGNLALKLLATGGVFLGGGIAPKILPKLRETAFLEAFNAKGRMAQLLREIPVRVVLNDRAALLGAARHGADLLAAGHPA